MLAVIPNFTYAYVAIDGNKQYHLDQNTDDNVYLAGEKVDVNANVLGDLFLAGAELMITGNVGDNAVIAGGNIDVKGTL